MTTMADLDELVLALPHATKELSAGGRATERGRGQAVIHA